MTTEKAVEARIRRQANAAGLKLTKLRGKDEPFILTDLDTRCLMFPDRFRLIGEGASLEDIQDFLASE